jgi:hypothetical protein
VYFAEATDLTVLELDSDIDADFGKSGADSSCSTSEVDLIQKR